MATKWPKMDRTEPRIDQNGRPDLSIDLEISKKSKNIKKRQKQIIKSFWIFMFLADNSKFPKNQNGHEIAKNGPYGAQN